MVKINNSKQASSERRAWRIDDFCSAHGVSRSTVYKLAALGKLKIRKIANRSVISAEDAAALMGDKP